MNIDQLLGMYIDLPQANRSKLRAIALDVAGRPHKAFYDRTGELYARELSVEDLRYIIAASRNPAFRRFRELTGMTFLKADKKIDYPDWMSLVTARFCKETGELCEASSPPPWRTDYSLGFRML